MAQVGLDPKLATAIWTNLKIQRNRICEKYRVSKKNAWSFLMAHNPGLESPKCKSKDSFEILRFSASIWAQEQGHFYAEVTKKIAFLSMWQMWQCQNWPCFSKSELPAQRYLALNTNARLFRHPVCVILPFITLLNEQRTTWISLAVTCVWFLLVSAEVKTEI